MSVSVVGTATTKAQASGATIVVNVPTDAPGGLQVGDMLVVGLRAQLNNSTADYASSGWTRTGPAFVSASNTVRVSGMWRLPITIANIGSIAASYTFGTLSSSATRSVGTMIVLRSSTGGTVTLDAEASDYGSGGSDPTATSITTTVNDVLVLLLSATEATATDQHLVSPPPSGMTQAAYVSTSEAAVSRTSAAIWQMTQAVAGATGTKQTSYTDATSTLARIAFMIAFRDVPPPAATVELNGGLADVSYYNGVTEVDVAEIYAIPADRRGYTLTEMDAEIAANSTVYWAHRGGSSDWSEMTMYAYTNCVFRGARALEVSVQRSSDGVWIMSHDADLTRVTATTHVIASTPSSTLLGIAVDTPITGGVIGRIEDLLEAYPEYVILVDNKAQTNRAELYALVKGLIPAWADQIIWKIDGANPAVIFSEAKAQGFKIAGYWFDGAVDTTLPTRAADTDYIGLNYDASASNWTTALSYGKPTWGHVCITAGNAATALGKGADILQCAGVKAIIPMLNEID